MGVRLIAACVTVVVLAVGPLQPVAVAQQAQTAPAAAAESAPAASPRRTDVYDVAAGVVTVAKAPFNVGLCALGAGFGAALFALTLGSGYRASARVVEEGCRGPWVVRGDDLRPESPRGEAPVGGWR
jgi:hypothetical protein